MRYHLSHQFLTDFPASLNLSTVRKNSDGNGLSELDSDKKLLGDEVDVMETLEESNHVI